MSREDSRRHSEEAMRQHELQDQEKRERPWARFVPIMGIVLAVFIPLLQSNGVEVNWGWSAAIYVILAIICIWSFLKYAVPNKERKSSRRSGVLGFVLFFGLVGTFATAKQYEREHTDDLKAVRVIDVIARERSVNGPYVFQANIENLSGENIRSTVACGVTKSDFPLKPFGIITRDTRPEHEFEDRIFRQLDVEEKSRPSAEGEQDLPAQQTSYVYCPSSWIPKQQELERLNSGEFVLYVAGRVRVPSKIKGSHVDVEFCRTGTEKSGLQNCYGHNVSNVHR